MQADPRPACTLVTDPWHLPPSKQNEEKWLRRCFERINKGWTHSVFADSFVASFYRASDDLVMQGVSRDGGVRFKIECPRLDLATLRKLVSQFPKPGALAMGMVLPGRSGARMKIFGPKCLAPACVPDRVALASQARENRYRISRLITEARKSHRAAALLFTPDALHVVILSWLAGKACFRCINENGDRLLYQQGALTSSVATSVIEHLFAVLTPDDVPPL
jgi:hypothetical protein